MRIFLIWLSIFSCFFTAAIPAQAATAPLSNNKIIPVEAIYKKIASMKMKDFRKLAGRKLTLKEKVSFIILKHKLKQQAKDSEKQGQTAFTFGLIAVGLLILGLFVPYVILGSLVAAILAIVTGSMAKKRDGDNRKAKAGQLLGWITLGLIAFLFILAAVVLASWSWG